MEILSTPNAIALLTFLAGTSVLAALFWALRDLSRPADDPSAKPARLIRLPRFQEVDRPTFTQQIDSWLERSLYWSALPISTGAAAWLAVFIALSLGGAVFVASDNELFAVVAALFGLGGLAGFLEVRKRRRLSKYEQQFPAALDLLARAVRAGESVEQAMNVVGESLHEPAGVEFQRCAGQLEMGLSLAACMRSLGHRVDQMDTRIFATTLSVHRDAGGNLPITLERLAEVIRDRMSYQRQLSSVTAAGRYSALLIASVGPLLFLYFFLVQPQYGSKLTDDPVGRYVLATAIVSEVIGLAWIFRLIRSDY
jgi:tight adherence protein B